MFIFSNKWKTLVLALLVVGFFCFLGGLSVAKAEGVELDTYSNINAGNPTIIDFEDTSVNIENGYSNLGVTFESEGDGNLIYSDFNGRGGFGTFSGVYSIVQIYDWPETSQDRALFINFTNPVEKVGFYLGNGSNSRSWELPAKVTVYGENNIVLDVISVDDVASQSVVEFVGFNSELPVHRVGINYEDDLITEELDYLMFTAFDQDAYDCFQETGEDSCYDDSAVTEEESREEELEEVREEVREETLPAYDETREEPLREEVEEVLPAYDETRSSDSSRESARAREVTQAREATADVFTRMSCGDSAGGNGLYSLCKGDVFYHDLGFNVYNRAYDSNVLKLKANGLTNSYVRLRKNTPMTVYHTDRENIFVLEYTEKSNQYGAFLQVSQEGETDMLPATDDSEEARDCEAIKTGGKRVIAFGDNKVYYAYRGYKYWFPNEEIYLSWFNNFAGITVVSAGELAGYDTGDPVCKNTANVRVSEGDDTARGSAMLPAFDESKLGKAIRKRFERRVAAMSCGDSEGGDGLYSGCKGDTIYHGSGVEVMVRAYDNGVVKFKLGNADRSYARTSLDNTVEVDSEDGSMTLRLTYMEKSAKYGAFVKIETTRN